MSGAVTAASAPAVSPTADPAGPVTAAGERGLPETELPETGDVTRAGAR